MQEVAVGSNMDKIFLVMEYVEHDLKALMESMKEGFLIGKGNGVILSPVARPAKTTGKF